MRVCLRLSVRSLNLRDVTAWQSYETWNDAVAEAFFPVRDDAEPVYMDFEDEALEALGERTGTRADDVPAELGRVVAATLGRGGPATIFDAHVAQMRRWVRRGRTQAPPFVAVLGAFCLAAEQMESSDGMSSSNYLGRLRSVLGWEQADHRLDQAYRRVAERFWGELNRWLLDLDGARGVPTAFALNHRYVGLTVSQALVRSADREKLKDFFIAYGFAAGSEVPPSELVTVLDGWIGQNPSPVSTSLARLWGKEQARERIAQSAAVALASWDGSHRGRVPGDLGSVRSARSQVVLTLELGGFPRKRFGLQALCYLPHPDKARDATIVTAEPEVQVELVPDLPGTLGLGRGASLHAPDVLSGVLRVKDSLSDAVVERRPRRMVLFREDDLSRRWVEAPQVMLGDSVRLLVHDSVLERTERVLEVVARPGWQRHPRAAGQPDDWTVLSGVEVLAHPGDLVRGNAIDDLQPLVPLTTSQLKVAGGFALPGRMKGKWHSWAPPEVRAISDVPGGFVVRVLEVGADDETEEHQERVLAEWSDDGTGVVVRSMTELGVGDGDYRVEILPKGKKDPLTSTWVRLRSADTPDNKQWATAVPVGYGPGPGVVGLPTAEADGEVKGHLVPEQWRRRPVPSDVKVPTSPGWDRGRRSQARAQSTVRLAMPDPSSCMYSGRHREHIDTVDVDARGRPLSAWTTGRCTECGMVRRYPTRLRWSGYAGRREPVAPPPPPDLGGLEPVRDGEQRDWATAVDALLHLGGGSWSHLERIASQIEPTALFSDELTRTLEALGLIDVRRDATTMETVAWEVTPTALVGTESGVVFAGYWPAGLYEHVGSQLEERGISLAVDEPHDGPATYFADCSASDLDDVDADGVAVVSKAWEDLAQVLPDLSVVGSALPRRSDSLVGDITWFQVRDNTWSKVSSLDAVGAFRVRRFSTTDVFRTQQDLEAGQVALTTVQLGKHLAALQQGKTLLAYDKREQRLTVPLGADLPGLFGRAAVAASGTPPRAERAQRLLHYESVPLDLALHLHDRLSR